MRRKVVTVMLLGLAALTAADRAEAQVDRDWALKLFDKLEHDFGVVPSNADLKYRLKITNPYKQRVHIASVVPNCNCTAGKPTKDTLESEETAWLDLSMDTRRFRQLKEVTLTVTFDQPLVSAVQIRVKAFITPDVALNPGALEFRGIAKGLDHQLKMGIVYNGHGQTVIKQAACKNPHVDVKLNLVRQEFSSLVYELVATVKGTAPLGNIRDQVMLATTDPNNPQIPVLLEAQVEPEFVVTPDIVSFKNLAPGKRDTIYVTVHGKRPFAIEKIESEKTAGTFETSLPAGMQKVHRLPLTLIAPDEPGVVADEFTLTIKGSAEPVTFKAKGKVVPAGG
jgi:hypothetical protein